MKRRPFHSSVSLPSAPPLGALLPSLPAGINEDDSDLAWGRIEAWNSAPLSGPHAPPGFRGVAIVLPDFPGSARVRPLRQGRQPQRNERHKGMWLCRTFSQNRATPPTPSAWHLTCGPQWHKNSRICALFSSAFVSRRKPGGPPRRIVVNRDPFRHFCLRETFEFRSFFHCRVESPRTRPGLSDHWFSVRCRSS